MPTRPLLPGTIPGLLRRCSPVVFRAPGDHRNGWVGIVLSVHGDEARVAWNLDKPSTVPLSSLALDLPDATGRAHAAWWLGKEHGSGVTDAALLAFGEQPDVGFGSGPTDGGWTLHSSDAEPVTWFAPDLGLDPYDDTCLPDGSRWVDAEALRLVVLHVAGLG